MTVAVTMVVVFLLGGHLDDGRLDGQDHPATLSTNICSKALAAAG
jgi:hypothetical protein